MEAKEISHADARLSSFKISIDRKHHDQVLGDDAINFWPARVLCRPFIRRTNNNMNNDSGGSFNKQQ